MPPQRTLTARIPYRPWILFVLFSLVNLWVTYGCLALTGKIQLLFLGLILPFLLAAGSRATPSEPGKPHFGADPIPGSASFPPWAWLLCGFPLLMVYGWDFGAPRLWQHDDSILLGVYALHFLNQWRWEPFQSFGQAPGTLSYVCWLLLKTTHSPWFASQFPPLLSALCTPIMAYLAARQYFPKHFSIVFAGFMASNYWLMVLSRTLLPGILLPPWECFVLYAAGKFFHSSGGPPRRTWAAVTGLGLGLGPYTFTPWPALIPLVFVLWCRTHPLREVRKDLLAPLLFVFCMLLGWMPFLQAVAAGHFGGHLSKVGAWNSFNWARETGRIADYLSLLFWGAKGQNAPPAGGALNPLSAALCFLGGLEFFRRRDKGPFLWGMGAFICLILPGLLALGMEGHRVLLVLPLLSLGSAAGLYFLAGSIPRRGRALLAGSLLLLSFGLNAYRLLCLTPGTSPFQASVESEQLRSYEILKSLSSSQGPGLVFPDLIPHSEDSFLLYYSYPFNAVLNPGLPAGKAKWASFFVERHYLPFLKARFPDLRIVEFPTLDPRIPSRHILALVPLEGKNPPSFLTWKDFYRTYGEIDFEIKDLPNGSSRGGILKRLADFYPSVPADPLLQSFFFEKLAYNYAYQKAFTPDGPPRWDDYAAVFRKSFMKSCKDAVLCEKYARLLVLAGKTRRSGLLLREALDQDPANAWLKHELREWGSRESAPRVP
jgi:hypothetical protein